MTSAPDEAEEKAATRLQRTLSELLVCLDDGAELVRLGRAKFDTKALLRRAAKNVISELGETVKRLPSGFTARHREIPWSAIAGMRDRTVHAYQHVDWDVVWSTLSDDLPGLRAALASDLVDIAPKNQAVTGQDRREGDPW